MKKIISVLLILIFIFTGCSSNNNNDILDGWNSDGDITPTDTTSSDGGQIVKKDGLQQLTMNTSNVGCSTEKGTYFITRYVDNNMAFAHISYIDYATKKESYLCSDPNCNHRFDTCMSNIDVEMEDGRGILFTDQQYLYFLVNPIQREGNVVDKNYFIPDDESARCATLYRMNLDGSERTRVYKFDAGEVVDDRIFYDGQNVVLIVSRLQLENVNNELSYIRAKEKHLVKLSLTDYNREEVSKLETDRKPIGCTKDCIIFAKEEYASEYPIETVWDDLLQYYYTMRNQKVTIYKYNINSKEERMVKQIEDLGMKSYAVVNNTLYYGVEHTNKIMQLNLDSGDEKVLIENRSGSIVECTPECLVCKGFIKNYNDHGIILNLLNGETTPYVTTMPESDLQVTGGDGIVEYEDMGGRYDYTIIGSNSEYYLVVKGIDSDWNAVLALIRKSDFMKQNDAYEDVETIKKEFIIIYVGPQRYHV